MSVMPTCRKVLDLPDYGRHMLALIPCGGEDMVPEQRHLLLKGSLGVDHAIYPAPGVRGQRVRVTQFEVVALPDILFEFRKAFRVHEVVHDSLVALRCQFVKLCPGSAEPSAAHQVGNQSNVISHFSLLL